MKPCSGGIRETAEGEMWGTKSSLEKKELGIWSKSINSF